MRLALVVALAVAVSTGASHHQAAPEAAVTAQDDPRPIRVTHGPVGPSDAATPDPRPVPASPHPVGTRNVSRSVRAQPLGDFLACVIRHESGGNPKAENPTSTASGLYQFIDASWRSYSRLAGHPGWSHAADAPASVQTAVAQWVVTHKGHYPWKGTSCGHGT